ncbi:MAG: hypothetical protein EOP49_44260, partial [Sphingobacteriales bacterium]
MKHYKDNRALNFVRDTILKIIDFFHPVFRRWIPIQTFRYLACGGGVTVLGLFLFFIAYNFVLAPYVHPVSLPGGKTEEVVTIGSISIARYIAAYAISFMISFP